MEVAERIGRAESVDPAEHSPNMRQHLFGAHLFGAGRRSAEHAPGTLPGKHLSARGDAREARGEASVSRREALGRASIRKTKATAAPGIRTAGEGARRFREVPEVPREVGR